MRSITNFLSIFFLMFIIDKKIFSRLRSMMENFEFDTFELLHNKCSRSSFFFSTSTSTLKINPTVRINSNFFCFRSDLFGIFFSLLLVFREQKGENSVCLSRSFEKCSKKISEADRKREKMTFQMSLKLFLFSRY